MVVPVYFGGLDLAKRVDFSAFILLEFKTGVLEQRGQKKWPHINYKTVAGDVFKINQLYRMRKICFDRSGVGDAAKELFSRELPLEEVISSLPTKIEIINLIHSLFNNKKLVIKDEDLYKQVLEQEKHISDAGNELYKHPSNKHDDLFWALGYACYAAKGFMMGRPMHSMSRIDTRIDQGKSLDSDINRLMGGGWNIYGG